MKGITIQRNPDRYYFVSHEEAARVLAACDGDVDWQLLFALARYGGLRIPSESNVLRWIDVDYVNWRKMTVQSPKTAHQGRLAALFQSFRNFGHSCKQRGRKPL